MSRFLFHALASPSSSPIDLSSLLDSSRAQDCECVAKAPGQLPWGRKPPRTIRLPRYVHHPLSLSLILPAMAVSPCSSRRNVAYHDEVVRTTALINISRKPSSEHIHIYCKGFEKKKY